MEGPSKDLSQVVMEDAKELVLERRGELEPHELPFPAGLHSLLSSAASCCWGVSWGGGTGSHYSWLTELTV